MENRVEIRTCPGYSFLPACLPQRHELLIFWCANFALVLKKTLKIIFIYFNGFCPNDRLIFLFDFFYFFIFFYILICRYQTLTFLYFFLNFTISCTYSIIILLYLILNDIRFAKSPFFWENSKKNLKISEGSKML